MSPRKEDPKLIASRTRSLHQVTEQDLGESLFDELCEPFPLDFFGGWLGEDEVDADYEVPEVEVQAESEDHNPGTSRISSMDCENERELTSQRERFTISWQTRTQSQSLLSLGKTRRSSTLSVQVGLELTLNV